MYAFQRFSCPSFFQPSTNLRMYRLLSKGLIGDPCGVPRPSSRLRVLRCLFPRSSVSSTGTSSFAILLTDVVNSANMGMVQSRGRFCFALETFQRLRILGQVVWKKFQRDETAKTGVFGFMDHAHSAAAQLFKNPVM